MEKLLPGVELQEIESELSSENGRILKRSKQWQSKQWHQPTGRRHHLAKVFHAMLYLCCATIVVSERMHAFTHQPTEKGGKRTCPRPAWQAWGETHTHAPSSEFLVVIASSNSLASPKSSQQQRDLGIEITAAVNVVQHKNKKRCSARWNEGKVVTVLYRIVVVDSKNPRFQSVLWRNPGEKNVLKQTSCFPESSEVRDSRMWGQTKAWGKTYQTIVVVWLPGGHTKRHGLRKWRHCVVPFAGYAHYAQSISALQWRHWTPYPWMAYEQECATLGLFTMPGCCHGKISLEVRHDSQHLSVLKKKIA